MPADRHDEINDLLTGPLTTHMTYELTDLDEPALLPPAWWHGDDDASRSSLVAQAQARR